MITRFEKLAVELPMPKHASPNDASAVQELLGGKFGEMSTLMNYTFQSFNFRGRSALQPFYDLTANIAAEEFSHIEVLSYAINLMLSGATTPGTDPKKAPLESALDARLHQHFNYSAQAALPQDSHGNPWTGANVVATGNLKMDMLHNFFLECGARAQKIRVYEMTSDPVARAAVGYLLVRGGVHVVAYAKALEKLSGVKVGGLLPIPDISNERFPEAKQHMAKGLHRNLYRFSATDYNQLGAIWNGAHPEDGSELVVVDGPPEGYDPPALPALPQLTSPMGPDQSDDMDPDLLKHYSKKLFG